MSATIKNKTGLLLWLSLGILIVSLYSEYIFGDDLFIFRAVGSDTYYQYWPFDRLYSEILRSGDLSHWTFRIGLGQQIFPLVAYLNPFRLLIHLMPPDFAVNVYVIKMILEIVCAVFLWRLYLSKIGIIGVPNTLFSLLYGFNGYLLLWGQHVSFGVVFSLVPITLYALELFLKEDKAWPLVLSLALFMGISIYFFAMFAVFFGIFVLARLLHDADGIQFVGLKLVKLACCGAIAGLLAAWIILPEVLFFLESPRVGTPLKLGLWDHFGWMHHLSLLRVFSNNLFGTGVHYYGPLNYYEAPQLYCGILTLLLIPQFFSFATVRARFVYGSVFILLTLALFSPFLAHLFNARFTLNNRYTFLLIVFWLFLAAHAFYKIEQSGTFHQPLFWGSWVVLFLLVGIPLIVTSLLNNEIISLSKEQLRDLHYFFDGSHPNLSRSELPQLLKHEFIPHLMEECYKIVGILTAYGALFFLFSKKRLKSFKPIFIVILAEIILLSYPTINKRATLEAHYLTDGKGYYDGTMAAVEYLESIDQGFYRITKDYDSVFLNDAAFQGYSGTKGYSSLTEPEAIQFYKTMSVDFYHDQKSPNYQGGFDERPLLNDLLGVKYLLSKEMIAEPHLTFLKRVEGINIYQKNKARPLGVVYHQVWGADAFERLSPQEKDTALLNGAIVSDAMISILKNENPGISILDTQPRTKQPIAPENEHTDQTGPQAVNVVKVSEFKPDHIKSRVDLTRQGLLFFSIPHNKGWQAHIDQQPVEIFPVNNGFMGIWADKGVHEVELDFKPYGSKTGRYVSLGTLFFIFAFQGLQRNRTLYNGVL